MPYGYDFNVTPVQVENGSDYQARRDAAAARKIELQQRQIELDQAKKAQALQTNQQNAARAAYQPQSYTPPAQSLDVGGANLGYQPAQVQGPAQFNRGSYLDALRQTDPLGAMQQQQRLDAQDIEHQKSLAAYQEQVFKMNKEQREALNGSLGALDKYFGAVDNAPPQLQPSIYAQAIQAAQRDPDPFVQHMAANAPQQFDPQSWQVIRGQYLDMKRVTAEANKTTELNEKAAVDAESARHNQATETITKRGQDLVNNRDKENQGSQVMQVPQPDGTTKLVRVKVGDALPQGAKTTAAAQKDEEAATADEKKKADLVTNARENLAALKDIAIRRPELFGPVAGRVTSIRSAVGTDDNDVANLPGIKDRFGMVSQGLHGMKNASHVAAAADAVVNGMKNSAKATIAAVDAAEKSLSTFQQPVSQQRGSLESNGAPSGATHAVIVGGKIIGYTADGKTMVPAK